MLIFEVHEWFLWNIAILHILERVEYGTTSSSNLYVMTIMVILKRIKFFIQKKQLITAIFILSS